MTDKLKLEGVFSKGYGTIPKLVMKDTDLTIEAKAIYAYLCSYTGAGETAYPSVSLITSDLGISEKRFHKHKNQLIDKGYISINRERKESGWGNNVYTIHSVVTRQNVRLRNVRLRNVTLQNDSTNKNSTNKNSTNKNSINKKSRNSGKPKYADDSPYMKLSQHLFNYLKQRNPEHKEPNWQTWADDFRKTVELDKRSVSNVQEVIDWSQGNDFWQQNILSPRKVREKYDTLKLQMNSSKQPHQQQLTEETLSWE